MPGYYRGINHSEDRSVDSESLLSSFDIPVNILNNIIVARCMKGVKAGVQIIPHQILIKQFGNLLGNLTYEGISRSVIIAGAGDRGQPRPVLPWGLFQNINIQSEY